jgi:hypothetical protein
LPEEGQFRDDFDDEKQPARRTDRGGATTGGGTSQTNSLLMGIAMLRLHCYLAEWYRSGTTDDAVDRTAAALESAGASMNFEGSSVALIS